MSVLSAYIVPHPPVAVPEVGQGREKEISTTLAAYRLAAKCLCALQPDTLLVVSPHALTYRDYFHIGPRHPVRGNLAAFGAPVPAIRFEGDEELARLISRRAQEQDIPAGPQGGGEHSPDHGVMVPLYFIARAGQEDADSNAGELTIDPKVVRLSFSGLSPQMHFRYGQVIAQAVRESGRRAVFIASADLSHKLKEDGPYGFSPSGPVFDREITEIIRSGELSRFLKMDSALCNQAAECGLRSLQILAGFMDGVKFEPELLSYEDTFGVGYAVAELRTEPGANPPEERTEADADSSDSGEEDPWVALARRSLETYVLTGKTLHLSDVELEALPAGMREESAGTFVSLHNKYDGSLRGCIGTIRGMRDCVAHEIVDNAISAGTRDPRFNPVQKEELADLEYSVDVLGPTEPVWQGQGLDAKRYGVIVSSGYRRGLLLPNLDGVDTPDEQIRIALAKAGIAPDEDYRLERFEVVRHQ